MKLLAATLVLSLGAGTAALGFESTAQAIVDRYKPGKSVAIEDIAQLMRDSEQWCYARQDSSCAWTDIYLDVGEVDVEYEIANAWDAERDIAFTDRGEFRDGRYICETGHDWVPSVRATRRSDGSVIGGRQLAALKDEIETMRTADTQDCFDYIYRGADADQETMTLLQRQYVDGTHLPEADVEVTLSFDAQDAAGLTWRW